MPTRAELGVSAALMARLPTMEILACYGAGAYATVLSGACARGIPVTNAPDVLTGEVADTAVGLAAAATRRIPAAGAHVRSGARAQTSMPRVTRLHGQRVGLVGHGRVGQTVARCLTASSLRRDTRS